jgi:hypothetical protein
MFVLTSKFVIINLGLNPYSATGWIRIRLQQNLEPNPDSVNTDPITRFSRNY